MTTDFDTSMQRALDSTRTQNLQEATRIIQEALSGTATAGETLQTATPPPSRRRFGLRDVMKTLKSSRKPQGLSSPATPPPLPDGAHFPMRSYVNGAEGRDYRLYIPSSGTPRGLVVMLHGCTQNPDDFASGTGMNIVAERHDLAVAYPGQTGSHNAQSCWNWFEPRHQARDNGEPAIIAGITREVAQEFDIGPDQVFIAGLSAGGAMAAVMAQAYPELYAAVGIHSGLGAGSANDVMSAFAAMRGDPAPASPAVTDHPRTIVFHGSADSTVHPSNADRIVASLRNGAAPNFTESAHQGRTVTRMVTDGALEDWRIDGAGHAWSGGQPTGSYTDPTGPDASAEMVRFFLQKPESF